ncbi:MAG: potassium/proton antiporter [Rubrivivax sp.]|nr:potassium/proton antiporter [Rubrivivax sp.]
MDLLNIFLLVAGALVFTSVVAGLFSARAGLSFLLVFLVTGMLAGEDGPGGIKFDNVQLSLWVGSAALGVILLDGGLRTRLSTFRTGLRPAAWLATAGVVVTAGITGLAASWLLQLPLALGLLVGAIVGSTDAAAVFALLKSAGLRVSERLSSTLEIESGLNDPMAVFLVLTLTMALSQPAGLGAGAVALMFTQQALVGAAAGLAGGVAIAALLQRLPLGGTADGLAGLLLLSSGIGVFGGAGWLGGSGFLAVYLFGLIVANRAPQVVERSLAAMDGFAWLAQALLFLLLGLLVTPRLLVDTVLPALGVAAVLMLVARPLAVALCLAPLRFTRGEIGFVSWVGLRGAVPVVLALFPLLAGVPKARELFEVAFVVVLASLVLQGATMARAAHLFGVNLPDAADEPAARRIFGDFVIDGSAPVRELCTFYGLALPEHEGTLAQWLEARLQRPPVVGDGVDWGGAHFSVRQMEGAHVLRVGLSLGSPG